MRVIIKFSVEVEGLPVYNETYDVDKLAQELKADKPKAVELWGRRIKRVAACRHKNGFSACVTRCLTDGKACNCGPFLIFSLLGRFALATSAWRRVSTRILIRK